MGMEQGKKTEQTEDSENFVYCCGIILLIVGSIAYVLNI